MSTVADCLALRRWALPVLARAVAREDALRDMPHVSLKAWRIFLGSEVLARPLALRLEGAAAGLPPAVAALLTDAGRAEVQRVMAARAQLAAIDTLADGLDVEPVVLKGGVAAAEGGEPVDLGDVDLLLDHASRLLLQRTLIREHGYGHVPPDGYLPLEGGLVVELHEKLEAGFGVEPMVDALTVPLARYRRLRRLSAVGHVVYVIQHATMKHARRRGHLRDIVLVADALARSSPADVARVEALLDASMERAAYLDTFRLSMAVGGREPFTDALDRPFRAMAASKYAISVWLPRGTFFALPYLLEHAAFFSASMRDAWRISSGYVGEPIEHTSHYHLETAHRISPRLAHAIGLLLRAPYRLAALSCAAALGLLARAAYALFWREPPLGD